MGPYRDLQEPHIQGYPLAGFGSRLGAYILDSFIWGFFFVGFAIVGTLLFVVSGANVSSGLAERAQLELGRIAPMGPIELGVILGIALAVVAYVVFSYVYILLFWAVAGGTPGKLLLGQRIVDVDGRTIGFGRALLRLIGYQFSGLFFYLGFLWIAFDRNAQGWHDKLASTYVIDTRRRLPGFAAMGPAPRPTVVPAPALQEVPAAIQPAETVPVAPAAPTPGPAPEQAPRRRNPALGVSGWLSLVLAGLILLGLFYAECVPQMREFVAELIEAPEAEALVPGERISGQLKPGESWSRVFFGEEGETAKFELGESSNNVGVTLYGPDGQSLERAIEGFETRLPASGRYTVQLNTLDVRNAGDYDLTFVALTARPEPAASPAALASVTDEEYRGLWAEANVALLRFMETGVRSGGEGLASTPESVAELRDLGADFGESVGRLLAVESPPEHERVHRTVLPLYSEMDAAMSALVAAADGENFADVDLNWTRLAQLIDEAGWLTSAVSPNCDFEGMGDALSEAWPADLDRFQQVLEEFRLGCPLTADGKGFLYGAYIDLGEALKERGDVERAVEAWTVANFLQPERPEAPSLLEQNGAKALAPTSPPATAPAESVAREGWQRAVTGQIAIELPVSWEWSDLEGEGGRELLERVSDALKPQLGSFLEQTISSSEIEILFVAFDSESSGYLNNLTIGRQELPAADTIPSLVGQIEDVFAQAGFTVLATNTALTIGGLDAGTVLTVLTLESFEVLSLQYIVLPKPDTAIILTFGAAEQDFDELAPLFDEIAMSFRLLD